MTNQESPAYRRSILVWAALMVLLLLTFGSAYLKLGTWNSAINLAIAAVKALLVAAFFMHLRSASSMLRIVAATALLTLALLFGLSRPDYATRTINRAPWQTPPRNTGALGTLEMPGQAPAWTQAGSHRHVQTHKSSRRPDAPGFTASASMLNAPPASEISAPWKE